MSIEEQVEADKKKAILLAQTQFRRHVEMLIVEAKALQGLTELLQASLTPSVIGSGDRPILYVHANQEIADSLNTIRTQFRNLASFCGVYLQ